jgi:serine/threonine protein kinase
MMSKKKFNKYLKKLTDMDGGLSCYPTVSSDAKTEIETLYQYKKYNAGFIKNNTNLKHIITELYQDEKVKISSKKEITYKNNIILGSGTSGYVRMGILTTISNELVLEKLVAIKEINIHDEYSEEDRNLICSELLNVFKLNHPQVVEYFGYAESPNRFFIFTEFVNGRDLFTIIDDGHAQNDDKLVIALQLIGGLKYLHEKNIYHRDIKPENIMIKFDHANSKLIAKYIDFTFSCHKDFTCDQSPSHLGTAVYMSPEYLRDRRSSKSARLPDQERISLYKSNDLWALGATLYFLFTGKEIFRSRESIVNATQERINEKITTNLNPVFNIPIDDPYLVQYHFVYHNIIRLLKLDPQGRNFIDFEIIKQDVEKQKQELLEARAAATTAPIDSSPQQQQISPGATSHSTSAPLAETSPQQDIQ